MMIQSSFLYRLPYLFRAGESRVSDWLHNLKLWAKFLSDEQQAYVQGRRAEQKVCDWKMKAAKETDTVWRQMPSFLSSCYMDIKHKPNKSHSAWALLNKQGSRGETQKTSERKTLCLGTFGKGNPSPAWPVWRNHFGFSGLMSCWFTEFLSLAIPENVLLPGNSGVTSGISCLMPESKVMKWNRHSRY